MRWETGSVHRLEVSVRVIITLLWKAWTITISPLPGLVTVPNEAVQDFTLISNQFNSDFGHSSGGQFNTTVKSWHQHFSRIDL